VLPNKCTSLCVELKNADGKVLESAEYTLENFYESEQLIQIPANTVYVQNSSQFHWYLNEEKADYCNVLLDGKTQSVSKSIELSANNRELVLQAGSSSGLFEEHIIRIYEMPEIAELAENSTLLQSEGNMLTLHLQGQYEGMLLRIVYPDGKETTVPFEEGFLQTEMEQSRALLTLFAEGACGSFDFEWESLPETPKEEETGPEETKPEETPETPALPQIPETAPLPDKIPDPVITIVQTPSPSPADPEIPEESAPSQDETEEVKEPSATGGPVQSTPEDFENKIPELSGSSETEDVKEEPVEEEKEKVSIFDAVLKKGEKILDEKSITWVNSLDQLDFDMESSQSASLTLTNLESGQSYSSLQEASLSGSGHFSIKAESSSLDGTTQQKEWEIVAIADTESSVESGEVTLSHSYSVSENGNLEISRSITQTPKIYLCKADGENINGKLSTGEILRLYAESDADMLEIYINGKKSSAVLEQDETGAMYYEIKPSLGTNDIEVQSAKGEVIYAASVQTGISFNPVWMLCIAVSLATGTLLEILRRRRV
jgi:hypothetical protein